MIYQGVALRPNTPNPQLNPLGQTTPTTNNQSIATLETCYRWIDVHLQGIVLCVPAIGRYRKKTYMPTVSAVGDSNEPGLANHEETKARIICTQSYRMNHHKQHRQGYRVKTIQPHTCYLIVLCSDNTTTVPRTIYTRVQKTDTGVHAATYCSDARVQKAREGNICTSGCIACLRHKQHRPLPAPNASRNKRTTHLRDD